MNVIVIERNLFVTRSSVSHTVTIVTITAVSAVDVRHIYVSMVSLCVATQLLFLLPTHSQNNSASLKLKLATEKQNANIGKIQAHKNVVIEMDRE